MTCSDDQSIRLWDVATGKCNENVVMTGHEHVIECVAWLPPAAVDAICKSPDFADQLPPDMAAKDAGAAKAGAPAYVRPMLLSGSRDKTIRLWDAVSGAELKVYKGHNNWVRCITVGNQGKVFYTCSDDKTVRVWCVSLPWAALHLLPLRPVSPKPTRLSCCAGVLSSARLSCVVLVFCRRLCWLCSPTVLVFRAGCILTSGRLGCPQGPDFGSEYEDHHGCPRPFRHRDGLRSEPAPHDHGRRRLRRKVLAVPMSIAARRSCAAGRRQIAADSALVAVAAGTSVVLVVMQREVC